MSAYPALIAALAVSSIASSAVLLRVGVRCAAEAARLRQQRNRLRARLEALAGQRRELRQQLRQANEIVRVATDTAGAIVDEHAELTTALRDALDWIAGDDADHARVLDAHAIRADIDSYAAAQRQLLMHWRALLFRVDAGFADPASRDMPDAPDLPPLPSTAPITTGGAPIAPAPAHPITTTRCLRIAGGTDTTTPDHRSPA